MEDSLVEHVELSQLADELDVAQHFGLGDERLREREAEGGK